MSEKTVFISYRHDATGNAFARLVHGNLTSRGYDAFIDVENLVSGKWEEQIRIQVPRRAHFLLLLTEGALEGCSDPKDWVRQEFDLALQTGRNIVVIREESVNLKSLKDTCPDAMREIFEFQSIELRHTGFDADFDRLIQDFIPPHKAPSPALNVSAASVPTVLAAAVVERAAAASKRKFPSVLINLILDILMMTALTITLLQGMNDDWGAALLIPITVGLKGMWIILGLPSEIKFLALAALMAVVSGSAILAGNLKAKKDLRGAWGIAGWTLLTVGIGVAMAVAIMQSVRGRDSSHSGD
jgi:hypothetical protein